MPHHRVVHESAFSSLGYAPWLPLLYLPPVPLCGYSGPVFACAGYKVIDNLGFDTVEAGVEAAVEAGAEIVVLCSSDDEYAELAPAAYKALAGRAEFVVAGMPACMEDLKAVGIDQYVNVKSNVLETLKAFNVKLGIN